MRKKEAEAQQIKDIRVTRVQKEDKKERIQPTRENAPLTALTKDEKLLRALKKKLYGINDIIDKQKNNPLFVPDEQQKQKVASLGQVMADMEALVAKMSDA